MRLTNFGLVLIVGLVTAAAQAAETVPMSRYFTITTCYTGDAKCIGPVVKELEDSNIEIELAPFRKGAVSGQDGWNRKSILENGLSFKSEIHLLKRASPTKPEYSLYVMLRSGKREGKVRTIRLERLSDLKEFTLKDETIPFPGGTLRAELVVGPQLPLEDRRKGE